jgi:hypothetical protein
MTFIIGVVALVLAVELAGYLVALARKAVTALIDHRDHAKALRDVPVRPRSAVRRLRPKRRSPRSAQPTTGG